jgi:hypothetical protein
VVDAKNPLYRSNLAFDQNRCQNFKTTFETTSSQLIARFNSAGPGNTAGVIYDFSSSERAEETRIGDRSSDYNLVNGEQFINVSYDETFNMYQTTIFPGNYMQKPCEGGSVSNEDRGSDLSMTLTSLDKKVSKKYA